MGTIIEESPTPNPIRSRPNISVPTPCPITATTVPREKRTAVTNIDIFLPINDDDNLLKVAPIKAPKGTAETIYSCKTILLWLIWNSFKINLREPDIIAVSNPNSNPVIAAKKCYPYNVKCPIFSHTLYVLVVVSEVQL